MSERNPLFYRSVWYYRLFRRRDLRARVVESLHHPGFEFPGMGGRDLLMDNLDFMLRFWKEKGYHCG